MLKPLWGSLSAQERQQLLQVLAERYRDESSDAMLAEQAAEGLPYPHLRQTLQRIAERERQHAQWLGEKIRALGGTPPPSPTIPDQATWQELLAAYESEKADKVAYLENTLPDLSIIHISEPTRRRGIMYAVFVLKKKQQKK